VRLQQARKHDAQAKGDQEVVLRPHHGRLHRDRRLLRLPASRMEFVTPQCLQETDFSLLFLDIFVMPQLRGEIFLHF